MRIRNINLLFVLFSFSALAGEISFSFDDAPYKVKRVLIETAKGTPGVLADPSPQVALVSYDEFSVVVQKWYNSDKGATFQEEILELITY